MIKLVYRNLVEGMGFKLWKESSMGILASLIYNPAAGSSRLQALFPEILRVFQSCGWEINLCQTQQRGDVARLAGEAAQQGRQVVLVAGGDGSLNEAVNVLAHSSCALGVLPTGTGNVWARQIGMPIPNVLNPYRLVEAAHTLVDSQTRTIDLGRTGERYFLMWSGVGLDGEVSASLEPKPIYIRRLGLVGYAAQAVAVAAQYRGSRMRIEADQQLIRTRGILAVASNGPLYAAILKIAPQARLDDGYLDLTIFQGDNLYATIVHALNLLAGRVEHNPRVISVRARRIRVVTHKPCHVQVDGEPFMRTPVLIEIVPRALQVLIPHQTPANLFLEPDNR